MSFLFLFVNSCNLSVWNLHVLFVSMWVLAEYFSLQSKNMLIRWSGESVSAHRSEWKRYWLFVSMTCNQPRTPSLTPMTLQGEASWIMEGCIVSASVYAHGLERHFMLPSLRTTLSISKHLRPLSQPLSAQFICSLSHLHLSQEA